MIDTRTYRQKCKRMNTDHATPCLCCPDLCVGDRPGHSIATIVSRAERRAYGAAFIAALIAGAMVAVAGHFY